jgi:hypothetical protein
VRQSQPIAIGSGPLAISAKSFSTDEHVRVSVPAKVTKAAVSYQAHYPVLHLLRHTRHAPRHNILNAGLSMPTGLPHKRHLSGEPARKSIPDSRSMGLGVQ